jgi:hypothetical protein
MIKKFDLTAIDKKSGKTHGYWRRGVFASWKTRCVADKHSVSVDFVSTNIGHIIPGNEFLSTNCS